MSNVVIKKIGATIIVLTVLFSIFWGDFNVIRLNAATVDSNAYCSGTSSQHSLNSAISNVCGSMGSSTYGYIVGNTSEWMCVSPNMSSPSSQSGRVEERVNTNMFNAGSYSCLSSLERYTVSQVVYGCCVARSSNWGMAHAVLSFVVNGDNTWLSRIVNGGMETAVRSFASQVKSIIDTSGVPSNVTYYLFIPNNRNTYQMLVNTSYEPVAEMFSTVNFTKSNSNGAAVTGAVIRFVGSSEASVSDLTCNTAFNRIANGIEFTTNGTQISIGGLKPGNTYTFHEVSAPSGYSVASDITVTVSSSGRVTSSTGTGANVNMVDNEIRYGSVTFHKKALEESGNNLQGARIVFSSDTPGGMTGVTYTASDVVASSVNASGSSIEFTTADVNDQITFVGLHPGATYRFHEISAPYGYISALDQTFTVGADGSVPNGGHVTFVDVMPERRYGSMRFFKFVDSQVADMIDSVFLYIYQEGHDAPFLTAQSSRSMRGSEQNQFGFGPGFVSSGQISDASQMHFYSDGWSGNNWFDFNGDGIEQPDELFPVDHPGIVDFTNPEDGSYGHWCYWVEGLPESMYTIVEDWIVGSLIDMTTSERIAVEGMNCDGWQKLPSYVDDEGNYHVRFSTQVLIAYAGGLDSGLNHSAYSGTFLPNYGAIPVYNSEASVRFDLTKIQHSGDGSDLSFQLWSMNGSVPANHIANGAITTSSIAEDTYSVNWTYQLIYPGNTNPTTLNNVDYVNHLPLGVYQLREYATNINAYEVPVGWERVTDSTGTYFSRIVDLSSLEVGYGIHPMQVVSMENRSGHIRVQKTDLWTGLPITDYDGTLSFDLYDNDDNCIATGIDLDKDGVIEFDLLNLYPNRDFPDSFYLVETAAPYGYFISNEHIEVTLQDNSANITVADVPYNTLLTIHKLDADTNELVNYVEFTVYSDTNCDGIHQEDEPIATSYINGELVEARVEFNGSEYETSPLRAGHYIIVESGLPEGYFYCDENGNPTATPNSYAFEVENQNTTAPDFVFSTYDTYMYNIQADIHTTLLANETGSDVVPLGDSVELTDIVEYENLVVGEEFVLEGILINKESGEPVLDENGNQITSRTTFVPDTSDGTVEVTFTVNTNYLFDGVNPLDLVAFESLMHGDRTVVIHADINDENQTVHINKLFRIEITKCGEQLITIRHEGDRYIPEWDLRALSDATFAIYAYEDIVSPDGITRYRAGDFVENIVTDANGYAISSNLFLGAYRIVEVEAPVGYTIGYEEIIEGEDIEGVALYTITAPDCIDLPFTPRLEVFKSLMPGLINGTSDNWYAGDYGCITFGIFAQEDIYAPDGTFIPRDGLVEVMTCSGEGVATSSINFPFGRYYVRELTTDMWHYIDDNAYGFEYERVSSRTETNNIISLGITSVITNYSENPSIGTSLTYENQHLVPENSIVTLVDTVVYENLKPWQQYELYGTLMLVHEDGTYEEYMKADPVVFATSDITSGSIDVAFSVDTSGMAGERLVAFERLTHGGVTVAVHMDLSSESQTVYVPSIGTTATVQGEHEFDLDSQIILIDTVAYENLIPGVTYNVEGVLMDKTYCTPLAINGEIVTASVTFVPATSNGSVDVEFRIDGSALRYGQELVAFECMYDTTSSALIAVHEDINSDSQTVIVRSPSPSPTPSVPITPTITPRTSLTPTPTPFEPGIPSTGEDYDVKVWLGIILVTLGIGFISLIVFDRRQRFKHK